MLIADAHVGARFWVPRAASSPIALLVGLVVSLTACCAADCASFPLPLAGRGWSKTASKSMTAIGESLANIAGIAGKKDCTKEDRQ